MRKIKYRIAIYNSNREIVKTFDNLKDFAIYTNKTYSSISVMLSRRPEGKFKINKELHYYSTYGLQETIPTKYSFGKNKTFDTKTKQFLVDVGFKPYLKGFDLLTFAVDYCNKCNTLTEIYELLEKETGIYVTTTSRYLRYLVDASWKDVYKNIGASFVFCKENKQPPLKVLIYTLKILLERDN